MEEECTSDSTDSGCFTPPPERAEKVIYVQRPRYMMAPQQRQAPRMWRRPTARKSTGSARVIRPDPPEKESDSVQPQPMAVDNSHLDQPEEPPSQQVPVQPNPDIVDPGIPQPAEEPIKKTIEVIDISDESCEAPAVEKQIRDPKIFQGNKSESWSRQKSRMKEQQRDSESQVPGSSRSASVSMPNPDMPSTSRLAQNSDSDEDIFLGGRDDRSTSTDSDCPVAVGSWVRPSARKRGHKIRLRRSRSRFAGEKVPKTRIVNIPTLIIENPDSGEDVSVQIQDDEASSRKQNKPKEATCFAFDPPSGCSNPVKVVLNSGDWPRTTELADQYGMNKDHSCGTAKKLKASYFRFLPETVNIEERPSTPMMADQPDDENVSTEIHDDDREQQVPGTSSRSATMSSQAEDTQISPEFETVNAVFKKNLEDPSFIENISKLKAGSYTLLRPAAESSAYAGACMTTTVEALFTEIPDDENCDNEQDIPEAGSSAHQSQVPGNSTHFAADILTIDEEMLNEGNEANDSAATAEAERDGEPPQKKAAMGQNTPGPQKQQQFKAPGGNAQAVAQEKSSAAKEDDDDDIQIIHVVQKPKRKR